MSHQLLDAHRSWHQLRIIYNIITFLGGLKPLSLLWSEFFTIEIILLVGVLALTLNGLFSMGYVLESYFIQWTKGQREPRSFRIVLFIGGTLLTLLFEFICAMGLSFDLTGF